MPYLLLETLISLHCGNPSKNLSSKFLTFSFLKAFFASACGWRSQEGGRNSAIAQKLLAKIDLKLDYVGRLGKRENRECVYQFVEHDDRRDSIFGQWLNRDEAFQNELVSVTNNISTTTPVIDTQSQDIPQTLTPVESPVTQGLMG